MPTAIHRWVEAARRGENPHAICRLDSGWAVMGSTQVLRGYCLLLPDPVVPHLNAMTPERRALFLADMTRLGDAVLSCTDAVRINYEMLGNLEPALHAHVMPRYDSEPEALRTKPVWFYDWDQAPRFEVERDGPLRAQIAAALAR